MSPLTSAGRKVLTAASELFYRDGINSVGVALVAETAGVTKKTLYDCFGSKDALVVRYLQYRDQRWWTFLEHRLETAGDDGVLVLFDAYLDHPELDTTRGCAFLNAAAELRVDHPGVAVIRDHKDGIRRRLAELVDQAHPAADPEVVGALVTTLFLILEGAIAHRRFDTPERFHDARRLAESHLRRTASARPA